MSTDLETEELANDDTEKQNETNATEKECSSQDQEESLETIATIRVPRGLIENEEMYDEKVTCIVKIEQGCENPSGDDEIESEDISRAEIEKEDIKKESRTGQPKTGLSMNMAIDMLTHYEEYLSSIAKDWRPEEGQVYVFDLRKVGNKWKSDGYEWRNNGSTIQPRSNPILKKVFFLVRSEAMYEGDRAFQKIVYSLISQSHIILVHYLGDSSVPLAIPKRKKKQLENQMRAHKKEPAMDLSARGLTLEETVDTLENYTEHLSYCRAVNPKGGEIYVFDREMIGEDWKCDGYIWRNSGTRYMPSRNPVMRKNFYFIRTVSSGEKGSREFKKSACFLLKRPNIILVHYMGDERVFTPRPHGNRKKGNIEFQRTCPSVIEAIKSTVVDENPAETYNRMLAAGGETPRDIKQVQSLKERLTRSTRVPRKKRKSYMTTQEAKLETIEYDPNLMSIQRYDSNTGSVKLLEVHAEQVNDENVEPLLTEPLHPHPEIRKVQLQILRQKQLNMSLQEEKLQLEIEKLERTKKQNEVESLQEGQVIQYVEDVQAQGVEGELAETNVIYVSSESDLINLTQGMYEPADGEPQYVFVQETSAEEVQEHYVAQM